MYDYRKMTPKQRREAVEYRRLQKRPWHSPPHLEFIGERNFIVSASCYEHRQIIGVSAERMTEFETALMGVSKEFGVLYAWCVLPNHYHFLVKTDQLKELRKELGKLHGRSSFKWNGEDDQRGRQVWHNCFDRDVRSHRHFWATMNYIHHNPVHHGYVERWQDWPWSSAKDFLERVGQKTAEEIWREYPVLDYGKKWDVD